MMPTSALAAALVANSNSMPDPSLPASAPWASSWLLGGAAVFVVFAVVHSGLAAAFDRAERGPRPDLGGPTVAITVAPERGMSLRPDRIVSGPGAGAGARYEPLKGKTATYHLPDAESLLVTARGPLLAISSVAVYHQDGTPLAHAARPRRRARRLALRGGFEVHIGDRAYELRPETHRVKAIRLAGHQIGRIDLSPRSESRPAQITLPAAVDEASRHALVAAIVALRYHIAPRKPRSGGVGGG